MFQHTTKLHFVMILLPASIFDESGVSQGAVTSLTLEALGMPVAVHGLDDTTHHKLPCNTHTHT